MCLLDSRKSRSSLNKHELFCFLKLSMISIEGWPRQKRIQYYMDVCFVDQDTVSSALYTVSLLKKS